MTTAELVKEVFGPASAGAALDRALRDLDKASSISALSLLQPITKLVVADQALLRNKFHRHSVAELASSQTLEAVALRLKPGSLREDILAHSADESRHARMFAALADNLASDSQTERLEDHSWLLEHERNFVENYNGDVIEFVCDLFAAEVRAYPFIAAYASALRHDNRSFAKKTCKVLQRILADEGRHIGYTGAYINEWMLQGVPLHLSLQRSFGTANRMGWIEITDTANYFGMQSTEAYESGGSELLAESRPVIHQEVEPSDCV